MGRIVVFGAGGRVGRAAVGEAVRRGHHVTAVVRDPAAYRHLHADSVIVAAGDVTDADRVADLSAGHGAAIMAAYDAAARPDAFFTSAARALLDGLTRAGVERLVAVGLSAALETGDGTPLNEVAGFPQEYRPFARAHAAGTAVLRASQTTVDWVVVSPAGDFDATGAGSGGYVVSGADMAGRIAYGDFALALLDEIDAPRRHRVHIGVDAACAKDAGEAQDTEPLRRNATAGTSLTQS
ncbi:NAD(P)-dependent oxidoreductase [Kitasatospora sp. NPDC048298]|uniref:NAD(P)-dependent oxidoreductase n=1 Tax=Kitasatospora sp. NPDC048298 TaxID=3364049 RepID=UPI003717A117